MRYYKKYEQRGGSGFQVETGESEGGPATGCWLNSHDQEGVPPQPDISRSPNRGTIHVKETQQSKETEIEEVEGVGLCAVGSTGSGWTRTDEKATVIPRK